MPKALQEIKNLIKSLDVDSLLKVSSKLNPEETSEFNKFLLALRQLKESILKPTDSGILTNISISGEENYTQNLNIFKEVWENSKDGMRITDKNGCTLVINPSYAALMELERDKLEGKLLNVAYSEYEKSRMLNSYLKNYNTKSIKTQAEVQLCLWNGKIKFVEISNSFLSHEEKSHLILTIFRDITDRKKA